MSHKSTAWAVVIVELIEAEYGREGIVAMRTPESKYAG